MKHLMTLALFSLALSSSPSQATVLFADNFDDGDAQGWSFVGNNSSYWFVSGGQLHHQAPSGYQEPSTFAVINGLTTPDQFRFEADITVISSIYGSDKGHVGLAWGINDLIAPVERFNTAYLRTHWDHVTHWSDVNGTYSSEYYLNTPAVTNGYPYHLVLDIDYAAHRMTTTLGNYTTTFTGSDFDWINANQGGAMGLISWHDDIAFDNIVISNTAPVPLPGGIWLFASGLFSLLALRKPA